MMGTTGYRWMFGGASAGLDAWRPYARLDDGHRHRPRQVHGPTVGQRPPGPRVSAGQAGQLGGQASAGARVDQAAKAITFSTSTVRLVAVAGPAGGPDETFRIAGLVNPAIAVPVGAKVSIQVINADPDTAHGLVITASQNIS